MRSPGDSAAPRNTGVCCGSSPPHHIGRGSALGAPCASPVAAASVGFGRCTRARPFQYRHSTDWPSSLTAKTRSCVSWKAATSASTSAWLSNRLAGQGHVELPHLVRVARLDHVVLHARVGGDVHLREERLDLAVEVGEALVDGVAVERVRVGAPADRELGDDVAQQAARGRERRRRLRHEHLVAAELLGDLRHREAARAAAGDHDRLARVDALVDGDLAHRADHVLVRDRQDRPGGALHAEAERPRHGPLDRAVRGRRVELQLAAEEVRRGRCSRARRRRRSRSRRCRRGRSRQGRARRPRSAGRRAAGRRCRSRRCCRRPRRRS